jgi:hypothetical protein
MDRYVAQLAAAAPEKGFRIGWDAGNGAAGPVIERLVKMLPGEHHLLFMDVDGQFPNHHPDPTEEKNLADLRALVARRNSISEWLLTAMATGSARLTARDGSSGVTNCFRSCRRCAGRSAGGDDYRRCEGIAGFV